MRRNAANQPGNPPSMDVDDVTSEAEADKDNDSSDMDSDGVEEPEDFSGSRTYELFQQQDFVGLT
jgi:hypothetical protein